MALSYRYKVPLLMLVATILLLRHSAVAQVTFSRDWTAGKRSLNSGLGSECAPNVKSTVALCQILVSELRQLASCEMRSHLGLSGQTNPDDTLAEAAPFPPNPRAGR
ncbi:adipokinetic hormone/corazonin-related peptide-like [Cloeon dipterum]|uniref:Adipokinetic hormone n=1 Tax=Cloeon dipterum TaxID=197152 RepID=A0A8S1DRK6_9INSE|nr:Hypothetical predicted protein [Cloeon dipterum]